MFDIVGIFFVDKTMYDSIVEHYTSKYWLHTLCKILFEY
jgi:hypothetical protein